MIRSLRWALVTALMVACGDSTAPSDVPAELVGVWVAEPACVPECGLTLHTTVGPPDSIPVTRLFSITTEVTLTAQGTFRIETLPSVPGAAPISGTARGGNGVLTVRAADGTEETVRYAVASNLLSLEFDGRIDFNGDGQDQPALAVGIFRRR
jgi:hypothetical protein